MKSVYAKNVSGSFNMHNTVHVHVSAVDASAELDAGKRKAAAMTDAGKREAEAAAMTVAVELEKAHAALLVAHEMLEALKDELYETKRHAESALNAVHTKLEQTQHALMLTQQQPSPQPEPAREPEPAMFCRASITDMIFVMVFMAYVFLHL